MKKISLTAIGIVICLFHSSFAQTTTVIDLHELVSSNGIEVFNREFSLITEGSHAGIKLSKAEGEGVAWIKGIEFSSGIIEFDVRGENVKQHSFVGMAFHGKDNDNFDAIYLRPFQFKEQDQVLRNRSIQYIALPEFTWRVLREKSPGKYEGSIEPSPDPDAWVHIRMVIEGSTVSTFVNGGKEPSLVVEKAKQVKSGSLGFYVADTSGGDFANLTITKTK